MAEPILDVPREFYGAMMEPIIAPPKGEMKEIGADSLAPTRCPGWRAINPFAKEMGGPFILNTAGTIWVFA